MLKSYKELTVWQKSIELVKAVYKTTDKLPKHELYVLSVQMRRSAISVPSNITEGYKRKSRGEYMQFLRIAYASASELDTQIIIAKSLYPEISFDDSEKLVEEIEKMLATMLKTLNPHP